MGGLPDIGRAGREACSPPPPRSAPPAAARARSPKPPSSSASATSRICSAVFSLDTSKGRIGTRCPSMVSTMTPPTITTSRNTTRIASQSGRAFTAARVTYIVTRSALSATGSRIAPSALPPPRRASQPSTASDSPAATNRKNESAIRCCNSSHTASGTAQSRPRVIRLGRVTRAADWPSVTREAPSGTLSPSRPDRRPDLRPEPRYDCVRRRPTALRDPASQLPRAEALAYRGPA